MKLSDIMSAAGLASYAEIGLILFTVAFVAVTIRVLWFDRKEELESIARIPLEQELTSGAQRVGQGAEGEAS
jgi:cbb3-type cytochrome oxidase subunit 3